MKPLLLACFLVIISCNKSTESASPATESKVKRNDLTGDYWKVFRATTIESKHFKRRTDTTAWVQYDYLSDKKDQVFLFRKDSTYECDLEIAFTLFISPKGRYIPNNKNEFDSIEFQSPNWYQKNSIRKLFYPETPHSYLIELNAQFMNFDFKGYGHVLLEQLN